MEHEKHKQDDSYDFYDSEAAAKMVAEYAKQQKNTLKLLETADLLEKQIHATRSLLLRRRRARLEVRLQRVLLEILMSLSPEDQHLGGKVYNRLLDSVNRLENII